MLLIQSCLIIFSSIPATLQYVYNFMTKNIPKSQKRQQWEYLISVVVRLCLFIHSSNDFYINLLVSNIFRKQFYRLIRRFTLGYWCQCECYWYNRYRVKPNVSKNIRDLHRLTYHRAYSPCNTHIIT
ncbi:unnamed protein product [Didymodactylos carnosus]|uniref:Uncharacterized protein n=2 Tax=Didymodactylos carnosus TaxID=1234261 RepID=A0A8S2D8F8_9BILA|nr:unnamed protein product [Didymodactylos carnosus]CAF3613350.1 unnamed protein product [Didymodactylos carnosus]